MRKQHSLLHFIFGFGVGAVVGFVLRNMESTEYNTGYQPKTEVFKEDDYFTDDVIKQHQEEKTARHLAKEANASKIQLHVPQYKDRSSDIQDNVEVMPEAEHTAEHSDAQMSEINVPQYKEGIVTDTHIDVETILEAEHEAMHDDAPKEAVEGTIEEIADDDMLEGLKALKEAVQDEDC